MFIVTLLALTRRHSIQNGGAVRNFVPTILQPKQQRLMFQNYRTQKILMTVRAIALF